MLKKTLTLLIVWLMLAGGVAAADREAGQSARLSAAPVVEQKDTQTDIVALAAKRRAIQAVLKQYNSPMADSVDAFMNACVKYDIDCYLLPAIAGLESSFGIHTWPGSNNAFGWGGGYIMFNTWADGIDAVAAGLRAGYVADGQITPDMIGRKYSESPTWSVRVNRFIAQFEQTEKPQALHSAVYSL